MASLPIMLLNERTLTPSFGYVFDPKWLDPSESIVSILWKLVRMNRLSGQMVVAQLALESGIDPYVGIAPSTSEVDIRRLHQALGLQLKVVRASMISGTSNSINNPYFRYCRKCLCRGYHGVIHQYEIVRTCPVHGSRIETECGECGAQMLYRINAQMLDAPYRCSNCRELYASCPPLIANRPPLNQKARVAITRLRTNHRL